MRSTNYQAPCSRKFPLQIPRLQTATPKVPSCKSLILPETRRGREYKINDGQRPQRQQKISLFLRISDGFFSRGKHRSGQEGETHMANMESAMPNPRSFPHRQSFPFRFAMHNGVVSGFLEYHLRIIRRRAIDRMHRAEIAWLTEGWPHSALRSILLPRDQPGPCSSCMGILAWAPSASARCRGCSANR